MSAALAAWEAMALDDEIRRPGGAVLKQCRTREFLDVCPPRIAEIFHYWDGLRRGRKMPRRADFRPEQVVRHLPGILLIDVEGQEADGSGIYRYRVVGTEEVRLRGHNPTGKLVRDGFFGPSLPEVMTCYDSVCESGSFLYESLEFVSPEGRWRAEHAVILPLSEDGETVSQILVYSLARNAQGG